MLHEYRDPQGTGICAGCGRAYGLCRGIKSLAAAMREMHRTGAMTVAQVFNARPEEYLSVTGQPMPSSSWDMASGPVAPMSPASFIERYGHVLRTPDALRRAEELLARVALLRLEAMDGPEHREFYCGWRRYAEEHVSTAQRDANRRAEVCELERWWQA